jgi:hypothetical protein
MVWYKKQEDACHQLFEYPENKQAAEDYLLTFNFRKQRHAEWVVYQGKRIFDIAV